MPTNITSKQNHWCYLCHFHYVMCIHYNHLHKGVQNSHSNQSINFRFYHSISSFKDFLTSGLSYTNYTTTVYCLRFKQQDKVLSVLWPCCGMCVECGVAKKWQMRRECWQCWPGCCQQINSIENVFHLVVIWWWPVRHNIRDDDSVITLIKTHDLSPIQDWPHSHRRDSCHLQPWPCSPSSQCPLFSRQPHHLLLQVIFNFKHIISFQ